MKDRRSALGLSRTVRKYATIKRRQTPHALTPLALDDFCALRELRYSDFRVKKIQLEGREDSDLAPQSSRQQEVAGDGRGTVCMVAYCHES